MKVDFHGRDLDSPHWQEMRSVYNFYGNTGIRCWTTHSYCIWFANLNAVSTLHLYIYFSEFATVVNHIPTSYAAIVRLARQVLLRIPAGREQKWSGHAGCQGEPKKIIGYIDVSLTGWVGCSLKPPTWIGSRGGARGRKENCEVPQFRKAEVFPGKIVAAVQPKFCSLLVFFVWFSGATLYKGSWVWVKMEEAVHWVPFCRS